MNIACVLRKSKDFQPEHVLWLKKQCEEYISHDEFICFSDVPVACENYKLQTDFPKWWAKMEIYKSDLRGPVLILDLDTVIRGPFAPTPDQLESPWVMRHFTRDGFQAVEEFACGIMLVPQWFRTAVWMHFSYNPTLFINEAQGDDQKYFKKYWDKELKRFQDEFPDAFVSYKLHIRQHGLREDNVFINFHGLPRPWEVKEDWIPCLPQA